MTEMKFESNIVRNNKKSKSMRCTVPQQIIQLLKNKDKINFIVQDCGKEVIIKIE